MSDVRESPAAALTILDLANYLEQITCGDEATRLTGLESLIQFRAKSQMTWATRLPGLWLKGSAAASPERVAVADEDIPERIRGVFGSVKLVNSGMGDLVFATLKSVDAEASTEWGPVLFCKKSDQRQIASAGEKIFDVSITQPSPGARAARRGGLRPIGIIVDASTSTDAEAVAPAAG